MQRISDWKKPAAFAAYIIAVLLVAFYLAVDFLPGFFLSTAGRLVLLFLCCAFLWLGGVAMTKAVGSNRPMKINLWIYLGLFLLLFATLTLFDPMWGRNGEAVLWSKELFAAYAKNQLNLMPFSTIAEYFTKGDLRQFIINIGGNFVCLMPLGILLPLVSKKQNKTAFFLVTCIAIVAAVEILQFATLAGSCDIDDLILNVGGAYCVYMAAKIKRAENFLRYIFLMEK